MKKDKKWALYIVKCRDNTLYTGVTNNLKNRIELHNSGKGAKYIIKSRRPVKVVFKKTGMDKSKAHKLEAKIKKMARKEKLVLIKGKRAKAKK